MNGIMNLMESLPVDSFPNPEMLEEMKNLFSPGCKGLAAPSRLQLRGSREQTQSVMLLPNQRQIHTYECLAAIWISES
jgi:hypothetical protein